MYVNINISVSWISCVYGHLCHLNCKSMAHSNLAARPCHVPARRYAARACKSRRYSAMGFNAPRKGPARSVPFNVPCSRTSAG